MSFAVTVYCCIYPWLQSISRLRKNGCQLVDNIFKFVFLYTHGTSTWRVNSLASEKCSCNFKLVIFKFISRIIILSISCNIALRWMPEYLTDNKSTLVQVMAWCRQVPSHCLNQCWPSSMMPYGITRPQWVNSCTCSTHWDMACMHYHMWPTTGYGPWLMNGSPRLC